MRIVARYDFNNGKNFIANNYSRELSEIKNVITSIDASLYKTKESAEKTMMGETLYAPIGLNKAFKDLLGRYGWMSKRVGCDYNYGEFLAGYTPPKNLRNAFREIDFIKPCNKLGVEVQFGKYAFMVYNVCAKMTIFKNSDIIDAGIEIVPVKNFADNMSTGVSYFEQFAWDLNKRGVSNIDIPVLIIGIDA